DLTNYQTVYSKIKGSVAAPTAGLHFTNEVFESLKNNKVQFEEVTLHVGAGTFQPVKTRDIAEHHMHTEVISVQSKTIEKLIANYGQIVAVGTTSVRTLESLYYIGVQLKEGRGEDALRVSQWTPYNIEQEYGTCEMLKEILKYLDRMQTDTLHADTQIMIRPGYKFRVINGMITNFHQPKSTLLLLVSAFVDGNWKNIYDYAMSHDFRFLSYGDSSLLLK
nr:S-adenosylmethionine:tRNA ribosyltransferase-isomerase [Paludibacter sp.]